MSFHIWQPDYGAIARSMTRLRVIVSNCMSEIKIWHSYNVWTSYAFSLLQQMQTEVSLPTFWLLLLKSLQLLPYFSSQQIATIFYIALFHIVILKMGEWASKNLVDYYGSFSGRWFDSERSCFSRRWRPSSCFSLPWLWQWQPMLVRSSAQVAWGWQVTASLSVQIRVPPVRLEQHAAS